jgi:dihydroorotate dehydrogenase electron transfer subunit
MQQAAAQVMRVDLFNAAPSFYRVRLAAPALAAGLQPGQFFLVEVGSAYARLALFPIALEEEGFSLLLPREGALNRLVPGDELDCIGPLGHGFPLPPTAQSLLLLAQAEGYGAGEGRNGVLFFLALIDQALAAGKRVVLVHEAPNAGRLYPTMALPRNVELRLVTADGSRGQPGSALDLLPELAQWADQVYAVGEPEWYTTLLRGLEAHRLHVGRGLAWGLLAPQLMPCGLGACGGCAVETRRGYRYACSDGPVFDLSEL